MFEWFADLSPIAKYGAAFLFLAGLFWPWGWAVGGVLLVFALFAKGGGSASDL